MFQRKILLYLQTGTPVLLPQDLTDGLLKGKTIVIDPGHGGNNPGVAENGFREADNNLAVGLMLRDKLVQDGAKVIMTRKSDKNVAGPDSSLRQELQARLDIAENNKADIWVSIHTNSNTDSAITGTTTYYPNGRSSELATAVQKAVIKEAGFTDKGTEGANFYVLKNFHIPSTLVEIGFISNKAEAKKLHISLYREKLAEGIYKGIIASFLLLAS